MAHQIITEVIVELAIPTAAPVGDVGINLSTALPEYTARQRKWLVTAVIAGGASNLTIWGALGRGVASDSTDDLWGLHNDRRGRIVAGVMGTALAAGTHHFIVDDIGIYTRLYFQRSANTVDIYLSPIAEETNVP